MTSSSSSFNDFPETQFTTFCAVSRQIGTTAYHALFCSKQDYSVFTTVYIDLNSLNTNTVTKWWKKNKKNF